MTKRKIFRSLGFLIACILLFSCIASPTFASDEWQTNFKLPRWTHIVYVGGGVSQTTDSLGRHRVGGEIILLDGDNIAEIEATVQHYNNGWYNTSHKWSDSGSGDAEVVEYVYLNTGTYRMRLVVKVYSPSHTLLEEETLYTGETII